MRILVVEDEEILARAVCLRLTQAGMVPTVIGNGVHADILLKQEAEAGRQYDAVLLDLTLPGRDGLELLRDMRRRKDGTPVLVATARSALVERVTGLEEGADDYLTKPYEYDELIARLRAVARRREADRSVSDSVGNLSYDRARGVFTVDGAILSLQPKSKAILEALIRRKGHQVTKEFLTNMDSDGATAESVDSQMSRLRKRLKEAGAEVRIRTLRGTGYVLEPEDSQ